MEGRGLAECVSPGGAAKSGPQPADREGLLKQSREFLDFFWDIAKPEQETRLGATENLLEYLRARPQVRGGRGGLVPPAGKRRRPGGWGSRRAVADREAR